MKKLTIWLTSLVLIHLSWLRSAGEDIQMDNNITAEGHIVTTN